MEEPDRERSVVEKGAFLANFSGCKGCGKSDGVAQKIEKVEKTETKDGEKVVFDHRCVHCDHLVATHR